MDCGREVTGSQLGLECDSCGFWHHAVCEKVSDDVYSLLSTHQDEKSILWYCKKCVVTCKRMSSTIALMHDHQQHLEERINKLADTMSQKIEELTTTMNKNWRNESRRD